MSLYHRYRPTTLDDLVGQPAAVKILKGFGKSWPRALMLHGPSGTGKTTVARILANLMCVGRSDYVEKNCGAVESAIDMVRDINAHMTAAPMEGDRRMWVLDEVQILSKSKQAQEALLKVLEDGPGGVHFVLCTTDPKRLIPTIHTRCVKIAFGPVPAAALAGLVRRVAAAEKVTLADRLVDSVVDASNGSPRAALVELEKVVGIADPAERLGVVERVGAERVAFDVVRELMPFKGTPSWKALAAVLADIGETDPESVRQIILASCRTDMLKGGPRAAVARKIVLGMADPLHDRSSGWALLTAWLNEIVCGLNNAK